jgi:hypothetical protein
VVAFCIDYLLPGWHDRWKAALLVLLFSHGITKNFEMPRLEEFYWAAAVPRIEDWAARHKRGEPVPRLEVPINPRGFTIVLY